MTTPSDLFMQSRIPYLVRKVEDSSTPEERMAMLAEIEGEVEAYAAKRRVEALEECAAIAREHIACQDLRFAEDADKEALRIAKEIERLLR